MPDRKETRKGRVRDPKGVTVRVRPTGPNVPDGMDDLDTSWKDREHRWRDLGGRKERSGTWTLWTGGGQVQQRFGQRRGGQITATTASSG